MLPEDATELDADRVDVAARLAWLLRVSRLSATDDQVRSLSGFVARMVELGYRGDKARVSQWETGMAPMSAAVISAYEAVLDLPPGQLRGVCETVRRTLPAIDGQTRISSAPLPDPQVALDYVYDEVVHGEPVGGDWLTLSDLMTGKAPVLMPTSEFERLAMRLVHDMMRSVGAGFAARFDALCRLVDEPRLTAAVLRTVHEVLQEPGVQAVVEPLSLYGEVAPHPRIVARMVGLLMDDNPRIQKGASHALLHMLTRQPMNAESLEIIERVVAGLLLDDPNGSGGAAAKPLAVRLPSSQCSSHSSRRRSKPGMRTGPHGPPAATVGRFVDAGRQSTGFADDAMFARLIREALSPDRPDRAHLANIMLLVSPYRASVAATTAELTQDAGAGGGAAQLDQATRERLGELISYVAGPAERERLHSWVSGPDDSLQVTALHALAHAGGVDRTVALDDVVRRGGSPASAALYAAGMSGHPVLLQLQSGASADLRSKARWWLRHGKAIQDGRSDVSGAKVVAQHPVDLLPLATAGRQAPWPAGG